ncbi:type II secretion system protein GspL [Thermodesulfobacteriota bacterium]
MPRSIFGLDIRNDAVSAVLIKTGFKGSWIEAYQHVPIPGPDDISTAIDRALGTITKNIDTTGSVCIASFPSAQISYRNMTVPFKDQKKIRQILPFELEATLPFAVSDIVIDFHTVTASEHSDIIAAAVEKSRLESYLGRLASFNVEPKIVTAGGYAIALCLLKLSDVPDNVLVLDTGLHSVALFAAVSGGLHLVRSFPLSSSGSSRNESICTDIERTVSTLGALLDLDYRPELLMITGDGADDTGMAQDMERILEIPVKKVDLIRDTDVSLTNHPGRSWDPGRMNNALALSFLELRGIRGLNFRRGPFAARQRWVKHKKGIVGAGIFSGLVIVLLLINVFIDAYILEKSVTRIDNQITHIFKTAFPDVKRIVDPVQQMRVKIADQKKIALSSGKSDNRVRVIDILEAVSRNVPQKADVNLSKLVVGGGNVLITGDTDTFNTVNDIKNRLEKVPFFKKIIITSTNKNKSGKRINFKLKAAL